MHLLYVVEGMPTRDPAHGDGSSMISYELIRHLSPDVQITLVAFSAGAPVPRALRDRCSDVRVFPMRSFKTMAVRSLLFGGSVGELQRGHPTASRTVAQLSAGADVTLLHGPHVAFLAADVRGPVVVQVVDPWSSRAAMAAEISSGWMRLYRNRQLRRTLATERALPAQARLLTVGRHDAEQWSNRISRPVGNVPNGIDHPEQGDAPPSDRSPTVCFVGSLNYAPNVEGAEILVREIAPKIWDDMPEVRFILAGRHPSNSVLALAGDRVDVQGNVSSVLDVFRSADVAVFPDRRGLGIRNSVSEALAAGLPVVATSTAAREQPAHPLLRVADESTFFIRLVREALTSPWTVGPDSSPRMRTWANAAQEYYQELMSAAESG